MKNKNLMILGLVVGVLMISLVSASWFSDLFNPTGNVISLKSGSDKTAKFGETTFSNVDVSGDTAQFKIGNREFTAKEGSVVTDTNTGNKFEVTVKPSFLGKDKVQFKPFVPTEIPTTKTNTTEATSSAECYRQGLLDLLDKCAPAMGLRLHVDQGTGYAGGDWIIKCNDGILCSYCGDDELTETINHCLGYCHHSHGGIIVTQVTSEQIAQKADPYNIAK